MKQWGSVAALLAVFVGLGWWMAWRSKEFPDQYVDNSFSGSRDPAAIRKSYDFSELDGVALSQASKQRLLAGTRILKENSQVGVELGHFVVRGPGGSKAFACDKYSRVILEFEGDGMAMGGDKPEMEVEGTCEVAADINRISPLWIPVAKIIGEPVAEGEFDFRDPSPLKVRFKNVAEKWPGAWALRSIRLAADSGEIGVSIEGSELRRMVPKPLILEFH